MNRFNKIKISIVATFLALLLLPSKILASGIGSVNNIKPPGALNDPNDIVGSGGLVSRGIDVAFAAAGVAAVAMTVYGGIKIILSAGDAQGMTDGQKAIINGIIGLIIVVLSYVIFEWLASAVLGLPAGFFDFNF